MKKVHRVIKFNQKAWLKPYIENDFEKDFFKLMNNAVFGKSYGNCDKHRNIKLVTTERRRNYLVSEPNYHATKFFTENVLTIEMRKTQLLKNKPVYLGLSILDLGKSVVYKFWYDYVKPIYIYIYIYIAEDVERRSDTLNFEIDRLLPRGKNKQVIGLMKNE